MDFEKKSDTLLKINKKYNVGILKIAIKPQITTDEKIDDPLLEK